jgi:hypothetical protein
MISRAWFLAGGFLEIGYRNARTRIKKRIMENSGDAEAGKQRQRSLTGDLLFQCSREREREHATQKRNSEN